MFVAAVMIAQQIAGKAARDAFFLTNYSASSLPAVMVAAAVLSVVVVVVVSRLLRVVSPARAVPWVFVTNAALFAGEYVLAQSSHRAAAVVVYLHTAALGAAAISVFWSVMNERFDPHTAKQAISRVAIGATFGGVVGGVAAWQLSKLVSIPELLIILAGVNIVCAFAIARVGGPASAPAVDAQAPSGLRVLRDTPYLRQLALLVALGALAEAAIDFVFKASAQAEYASASSLVTFFAIFYTATGVLTFLLQTSLVGRTLRTVGLTGTVAMRPAMFVGGGILALAFPRLWAAAVFRGGAQVVENSFYRSGYEVLYTPLTPKKKRPTKTMIDVGFEKVGVAVGAGIVMLVVAWMPGHAHNILLGLALGVGALALAVCTRLHGGYVEALAESLREGVVELKENDVVDRTTLHTLSQTATALSRDKLLREIERMRADQGLAPVIVPESRESAVKGPIEDPIVAAIVELRSRDVALIRRRLRAKEPLDSHLIAHVIPLLEDKHHLSDAIAALRGVAADNVGQLIDALLDPTTPTAVRRRLPRVISHVASQRAVDGLVSALSDRSFDVRDWCGVALNTIVDTEQSLELEAQVVFDAVIREAAATDRVAIRRRREHIANALSLVLDRDTIQLAFRALVTDDPGLRGTGLEYLENVVPRPVYAALRPLFETKQARPAAQRSPKQVVDELLTSVDTRGIDIAAVRAHVRARRGG